MARKRTIDPDIWTDDKVQSVPDVRAITLYIGTISIADDFGRLQWSARQLWGRLFPSRDDVRLSDIESWMTMLVDAGLLQIYEGGGARLYAQHPAWDRYQYVSRPTPSRIPAPPTGPLPEQSPDNTSAQKCDPSSPENEESEQAQSGQNVESGQNPETARKKSEQNLETFHALGIGIGIGKHEQVHAEPSSPPAGSARRLRQGRLPDPEAIRSSEILRLLWPIVEPIVGRALTRKAWEQRNRSAARNLAAVGRSDPDILAARESATLRTGQPVHRVEIVADELVRLDNPAREPVRNGVGHGPYDRDPVTPRLEEMR